MKTKVYIAGAYQHPDQCINTNKAILVADKIAEAGMYQFVPHLYHFWHTMIPHEYQFWMDLDEVWLRQCDVFFRIDGDSKGADKEEEIAKSLGMPIYKDLDKLIYEKKEY